MPEGVIGVSPLPQQASLTQEHPHFQGLQSTMSTNTRNSPYPLQLTQEAQAAQDHSWLFSTQLWHHLQRVLRGMGATTGIQDAT